MTEQEVQLKKGFNLGKIPIEVQKQIDLLYNELDRVCTEEGIKTPPRYQIFSAAIMDWFGNKLSFPETMKRAQKMMAVEEVLEKLKKAYEKAVDGK